MMKFRSLTNVRPSKDLGSQIICAPTVGQFKVTPEAAKTIGVMGESYLDIVMDEENNAYAVKGSEESGGKLAAANKNGGGILTFSSANSWEELDGDTDSNTHFSIDAEDKVEIASEVEGEEPTVYFKLTFVEKVAKQVRKKKGTAEEVADGTASEVGTEQEIAAKADGIADFENL